MKKKWQKKTWMHNLLHRIYLNIVFDFVHIIWFLFLQYFVFSCKPSAFTRVLEKKQFFFHVIGIEGDIIDVKFHPGLFLTLRVKAANYFGKNSIKDFWPKYASV